MADKKFPHEHRLAEDLIKFGGDSTYLRNQANSLLALYDYMAGTKLSYTWTACEICGARWVKADPERNDWEFVVCEECLRKRR